MSPTEIALIISASATLIVAFTGLAGVLISLRNSNKITAVGVAIEDVKHATNGMKSDLVAEVRATAAATAVVVAQAAKKELMEAVMKIPPQAKAETDPVQRR
jgi:hypothetical protein